MTASTITFVWNGTAMVPLPEESERCRKFVVNRRYNLSEGRSRKSHNHYFTCVDFAWLNLPEHYKDRFATSEHLRKWALIKDNYRTDRMIVAASDEEALRWAAFISPVNDYAVITVQGAVVTVYTAKSQSEMAMDNKRDFEASKQDVLEIVAGMIGVDVETLKAEAVARPRRSRQRPQRPSPSITPDQSEHQDERMERANG